MVGLTLLALACSSPSDDGRGSGSSPRSGPDRGARLASRVHLVEVTAEWGVDFVHRTGSAGSFPMPAIMSGGAAVFDYDGDGDLDLYFVDAGDRFPSDGGRTGIGNRLYRQEQVGRFVDVTDEAGVGDRGYGMGTAVGDLDNDGDLDLFVSNWGRDALYRNRGDGTFEDITARARVGDPGFSSSAVFCELTGDDLLDLYVARYVDFDPAKRCSTEGGREDYCGPTQFDGLSDRLYRNLGDGRFEDISVSSGIASVADAGLGVLCLDFDGDGRSDIYVANDADPNQLWTNQGNGRFVDDAVLVGLAFNRYGVAEAGMGVVAGDRDGDGDLDIFLTHLIEETNTLYENRGEEGFDDATATSGLAVPSVPYTAFGVAWVDLDHDGDLDLPIIDGGVKKRPSALSEREDWFWRDYAEPNLLFENVGGGRFEEVGGDFAEWSRPVEVSRGLIAADLDGDGDPDLVSVQIEGPARIWRNDGGSSGSWLSVRAIEPAAGGRDAIGARVRVQAGDRTRLGWVSVSQGYLTSSPATVHFGLGEEESVERIEVTWPDGVGEEFPGGDARRSLVLRRGEGTPPP